MADDSNVIPINFERPTPDEQFRSQLVDVLKSYFSHETFEGVPNAITVEIVLCALCQAIQEDGLEPAIFDTALRRFAEQRYGYKVLRLDEFDRLRREIEAKILSTMSFE